MRDAWLRGTGEAPATVARGLDDVIVVERVEMKGHVGVSIGQNIRLHWRGEKNQLGSVQDLKKGEILMLHGLGMKGRRYSSSGTSLATNLLMRRPPRFLALRIAVSKNVARKFLKDRKT